MALKTVTNFNELKSAIQDTATTEIILANDIVFLSGGIQIPKTKGNITLDGNGFKITDYNSTSYADTINFPNVSGNAITFTVKNTVWNGKNYYGVIGVYDSQNSNNVTIILDTVTYTGPQLIFNRYGITRIKDCTVNIEQNGSPTASQELCEGNRVFIEGKVNVHSQTTANAVIWFPNANSSFTVEANSSFILNAPSTYMFYTDTSAKPVLTFKENSITDINVKNGLFYASGRDAHIASSCTLKSGATFKAVSQAKNSVPMFKCVGNFSAEAGSSFQLVSPSAGSAPLMYFADIASVTFQSPKHVVLYNNGGPLFSLQSGTTTQPNSLNFSAQQINTWNTAKTPYSSAGDFSDKPTHSFYKLNYTTDVTVTALALPAALSSVVSNLVPDDPGYPLNINTFNILTANVLSMGNLLLEPDNVSDISDAITGKADAAANIKAEFSNTTLTGTAADDGKFSLPLTHRLSIDTQITISANKSFLIKNLTVTVSGSVSITHLTDIDFYSFAVPSHRKIIKRFDPNWYLEITDTRKSGGDWFLYVALLKSMQSGNNNIDSSLTFYKQGNLQNISDVPILIKQGTWADPPAVTRIAWEEIEGLLLTVLPEFIYPEGKYVGQLQWMVTTEKI